MATFIPKFKQVQDLFQGVNILDSNNEIRQLEALSKQHDKLQGEVSARLKNISDQVEHTGTDAHYHSIENFLNFVAEQPGQEMVAKRLQDTVRVPNIAPNQKQAALRRLLTERVISRFVTDKLFKHGRPKSATRDAKIEAVSNKGLDSYLELAQRQSDQAAYDDVKKLVNRFIGLLFDLFNIASIQMGLEDGVALENQKENGHDKERIVPMPVAH